ncbi:MAG: hypothetical protein WA815_17060 [Terracidiphilus sp.]
MNPNFEPLTDSMPVDATQDSLEFSLVQGGLWFRFCRRTHLAGESFELVHRQALLFMLITWLPLLLLSALQGYMFARTIKVPFLRDIAANARFLVALPALIFAELGVHRRISPLIRRFTQRRIIETGDMPKFAAAVKSAMRLRDLVFVEAALLVSVYTIGLWVWRSEIALGDQTWYALPDRMHLNLTLAGYWYVFVSIPIFQFLLVRWYLRLVIWFRLLWQISKLPLHLSAAHPDRAGGIGFLGAGSFAFAPILFAQGALLSGWIADRVLIDGRPLMSFKLEAVGTAAFLILVVLGPLVMFMPQLAAALRKSSAEYGVLASRLVFCFEEKWVKEAKSQTNELLSNEDLRSLSELSNVYTNVRQMRLVPFWTNDIVRLAVSVAAPLLPLALTILSPMELLRFVIKMVFH